MVMQRIARSFRLVAQSFHVLMQDRELMILPLLSGIVMAAVVASFAFGAGITTIDAPGPESYLPLFLMYVALYAVGLFFQCAVVAGATERMRGGDPTVTSALAAASRRMSAIVLWALLAATVGMVLRAVQDRVGFIGKVVVAMVGAAWSLATFFVVPVLVLEDVSVKDVLGRSFNVLRGTWGETFVGGASLGIAAFCAWVTLVAVTGLAASLIGTPALLLFGVGAILLMIFFSALQGVYVASLYRYATEGAVAAGFDRDVLSAAFVPKKR
jgi:hypothetical protein